MNGRRLALALGLAAFVAAVAVLIGVLDVGFSRTALVVVGLVAIAIGLRALFAREPPRSVDTPDPERSTVVPTPGATLHGAIDAFRTSETRYSVTGRRTVEGLRAATIAVLSRFDGNDEETARRRLETGEWTDDEVAAAFLSESLEVPRSARDWVADTVRGTSRFRTGVRRAVAAIEDIADGGDGGDGSLPRYDPREGASAVDGDRRHRTATSAVEGTERRCERATGYWRGVGVLALVAVGVGVVAESPAVVLAGVVGVGYAGFSRAFDPPEPELSIERELSDPDPAPGDEIEVSVTIANESDGFVPDLRIVDGVPAGMAVTEGASRLGTALRPGEDVVLEYTVSVGRGSHEFDPVLAIVGDLSRSTEREYLIGAPTTVVCEPELRPIAAPVPLRTAGTSFSGRLQTSDGGAGTTFHSVREYRKGDALSRVDWNRRAKTGELTTLQFHEERAARVVVLVDARRDAYLAPDPDAVHAVDRSVVGAGRIAATLLADGDTVGLAGIGAIPGAEDAEPCWLPPASGRHHEVRFAELLATHPQFSANPPTGEGRWLWQLRGLRRRLSTGTQIVMLTPLCDYVSAEIARRLDARGYPVTVVSPDPTADETAGQRLARVGRAVRRFDLQRAGIPVVDWPAAEAIDAVFARRAAGDRR
ncbi:DUF58 domain-containing protein [Natronococcus occultus]|uniref:DUF58 domain-containing protein n=1 Tax=Natronococcus occultus SP4 TaxID=694430 RepID=L0K0F9_9EURY|nr:DUF58 domain-containing protein [Natronococcus occultus]AGB37613.1 hypothetical protein Natoc_1818 [Natronococcus occultus SP4]